MENDLPVEIMAKKGHWDCLEQKLRKLMKSIDFLPQRINISAMLKFRAHS